MSNEQWVILKSSRKVKMNSCEIQSLVEEVKYYRYRNKSIVKNNINNVLKLYSKDNLGKIICLWHFSL